MIDDIVCEKRNPHKWNFGHNKHIRIKFTKPDKIVPLLIYIIFFLIARPTLRNERLDSIILNIISLRYISDEWNSLGNKKCTRSFIKKIVRHEKKHIPRVK